MSSPADEHSRDEQLKADNDLRELMKHPRFRRWWMTLVEAQCGLYSDTFTMDARVTDRNLGRQSIGRELLQEVQRVCPDLYVKGLAEALEARDQDRELAEQREQQNG